MSRGVGGGEGGGRKKEEEEKEEGWNIGVREEQEKSTSRKVGDSV